MSPPESPLRHTRRRVRVFIAASLLSVLAVGFWPVRGYRIEDAGLLARSFDPPLVEAVSFGRGLGLPDQQESPRFEIWSFPTFRAARRYLEMETRTWEGRWVNLPQGEAYIAEGGTTTEWGSPLYSYFGFRNLVLSVSAHPDSPDFHLKGAGENALAHDTGKLVDAIKAGAPGVGTVYLPPAVQLWRDKGAPFLRKHFP